MQKVTLLKAGISAAAAVAVSLALAAPSRADIAPTGTDAVGVGSDTAQYVADFVDDGYYDSTGTFTGAGAGLITGYNTFNKNRVFSFDATGDASGRATYTSTGTTLATTVVLRQGQAPAARPNGSSGGITALLNDTSHSIDFVRSSRLPKGSEATGTAAQAFGGLYVVQIADDSLQIATIASGSNVPAGLTATDLENIYDGAYQKWSDVPGCKSGAYVCPAPNDGIVPVTPQSGSGTRNDFFANIATLSGGSNLASGTTFGSNVVTAQEHDPTGITGVATKAADAYGNPISNKDALSPFSTGRNNLLNTGYLGASLVGTIALLPTSSTYYLARHLYIIMRANDVNSTTKFQAGGTQNLAQALFTGVNSKGVPTNVYGRAGSAALFSAAGVTQDWANLGTTGYTPGSG